MKTGRYILLFALLFMAIVVYINKCSTTSSTVMNPGIAGKQPLKVNAIVVNSSSMENLIYASGTLLANEEVEIKNEIAGKITAIIFKEGSRVKKGDLLLTLYDDDLLAQLKKLQLQKEIAEKSEERQKDLLTVNGISQQDYDISLNQLNTIKADIDLIHSNLSKTQIAAPFGGIIGLKSVSRGAFLAANTTIATIQSIEPVKLEFALPERYRMMININSEIHFTTESSDGIFKGKIYAFEPKIDLKTRSVLVRAICKNDELKLFPGAFAHIEIPLKKEENTILIPTQAIVPELKGQKVFISKNGIAEKISVETGIRNDTSIQITSGLKKGDTLLVTGIMQVKQGMPLTISIKDSFSNSK